MGAVADAISVLEEYARMKPTKPYLPYTMLAELYVKCYGENGRSKARDALERGVVEREPKAVMTRVRYDRQFVCFGDLSVALSVHFCWCTEKCSRPLSLHCRWRCLYCAL
jgi:hypothetical protein